MDFVNASFWSPGCERETETRIVYTYLVFALWSESTSNEHSTQHGAQDIVRVAEANVLSRLV